MRIGLVALSGLRLCDEQLVELGFSFPAIQERARQIEALPSLGLLTLAGLTPDSIEQEYLEIQNVDEAAIERCCVFDAIAISALTAVAHEAYRLAAACRARGVTVILGGLHATLAPDEAQAQVDCLVVGEGEAVWPELLRDLEGGCLKPRYQAEPFGAFDLADAPMPRFELLGERSYPRFTVQTQRGCPLRCDFCAASIHLTPKFKTKPPDRVVAEIRRLKELVDRPFIEFADDNTFALPEQGKRLMRALIPEHVRWFTETDLRIAEDPELLALMKAAGCAQVLIGFESPVFGEIDGVEQRSNWKAKQVDRYLAAVETIQSQGIAVNGCFVMGLDGCRPERFDRVFDFVERSGLLDVQITYLTPFPGTELYRRLSKEGRILSEAAWDRCTLFDINFQPDRMTVEELRESFYELTRKLYGIEAVRKRRGRFRRAMQG